jgi:nucleolar protein 4
VRQIPIFVTERLLKRLVIHAVRAFKIDVKEGSRQGLIEDELADVEEKHGDDEPGNDKTAVVRCKGFARKGVKQVKIVRQPERVDPITGKGRSKGYGFVEMHKHSDALRVLRWANNNPDIGRIFAEWRKDELQDLLELERLKEEKDEARIKKMDEELERGVVGSKGKLIVEFSIENVQVVQRRSARQTEGVAVCLSFA